MSGPVDSGSVTLDEVDLRLLEILAGDGRAAVADVARQLGIARATAYSRITRLERAGVIAGYAARVRHERAGLGLTAIVLIHGGQPSASSLRHLLAELPQVEKAWYVTGLADVLVVVHVRDVVELRTLVLERLQNLPDVRSTQTILALEQVVDRPYVTPGRS